MTRPTWFFRVLLGAAAGCKTPHLGEGGLLCVRLNGSWYLLHVTNTTGSPRKGRPIAPARNVLTQVSGRTEALAASEFTALSTHVVGTRPRCQPFRSKPPGFPAAPDAAPVPKSPRCPLDVILERSAPFCSLPAPGNVPNTRNSKL